MQRQGSALVVGVGPGLGWHLVKRFAAGGLEVTMAARNRAKLLALLEDEPQEGVIAEACDATDSAEVARLFAAAEKAQGKPSLVVFNAGTFARAPIAELPAEDFERAWRVGCLGGFHVGQAAARAMLPAGRGTILFTGATASLRGGAGFAAFAASKFALRALAQSMARELGPRGVHVAHVIIDGQIAGPRHEGRDPASLLDPAAIAETYWRLHQQDPTAWTFELDLRPSVESF